MDMTIDAFDLHATNNATALFGVSSGLLARLLMYSAVARNVVWGGTENQPPRNRRANDGADSRGDSGR